MEARQQIRIGRVVSGGHAFYDLDRPIRRHPKAKGADGE